MNVKTILLRLNWVSFIIIALLVVIVINMAISASYHPNAPNSPYFSAIAQIWLISVVTSFFLSLLLTLSSGHLSTKKTLFVTAVVYGILVVYALISFFLVKPVPTYFIQSVGDTKYQVPSEFVFTRGSKFGIRIELCLQTLKGIYSPDRGDCSRQSINLSIDSVYSNSDAQFFFEQIKEFKLNGDQIIVFDEAKKYQVYSKDKLRGYTIDSPWVSQTWRSEVQAIHKKELPNVSFEFQEDIPIHLLINDQNELVRFADCNSRYYKYCNHYIKTDKGMLNYELRGSIDFNFELWQATDHKILNLISQWKVD